MGSVLSRSGGVNPVKSSTKRVFATRSQDVAPVFFRSKSFVFVDPDHQTKTDHDYKYDEEYQHFVKSIIPTFHFQDSLPRLPIPELEQTCKRYLRAQRPLRSDEEYSRTKSYIENFLRVDGIKCQNRLIDEDTVNNDTSYISKPWFDMYLTDRAPLPINYNPFLVFVNHPVPEYNMQAIRATNLVISSLRFYKSLSEEILEPEVYHLKPKNNNKFFRRFTAMLPTIISWYGAYMFKAFPLDMSQYKNLFSTSRIPRYKVKDRIRHIEAQHHILVMRGGNFYTIEVLDQSGDIKAPDVILSAIEKILNNDEMDALHPVGVLTTEDRDVWAVARAHLEATGNYKVLDLIDTALFNLVLDDDSPGPDPVSMTRFFLHGDGTNRWFDKSFSLIVAEDGTAGVNFEHSWGDGVAVLRYFNDVYKDSTGRPRAHPDTPRRLDPPVRKLEFNIDGKAAYMINEALQSYSKTYKSLEVRAMDYRKCGRHMCSSVKMSPDALMQLAFQIAHFQVTGHHDTTYESCSTAAFKHGRTEAVRPCTIETQAVCRALSKSSPPSKQDLREMVFKCSKVHSELIKEAAMGQGFDRHLFALRLKANELGLKPDLFKDPAYAAINHNILSTSTLASDHLQLGAFGPVVPNGYGIGYSLWGDRLGSIVTNYKGQADGAGFIHALEKALDKLNEILKP